MKIINEKIPDLRALYVQELRVLLSTEEMIAIKTQFLADSATDSGLRETLRKEVEQSEARAVRIREIVQHASDEVQPVKCKVVYALFDEAEEIVKNTESDGVHDAAVLAAAQRVKHYEIASYGSLREFARTMGRKQDAQFLDEAIFDEDSVDHTFGKFAERINTSALRAAELQTQTGVGQHTAVSANLDRMRMLV